MARKRFGKAIGARSARKMMREIGGAPAIDLIAEYERVVGPLGNDEIVQLTDGRVLHIPRAALDGSVDGLERLDRAAQRIGGQECLDDPTILAPLVAYVGEVIRNTTGGDWKIDVRPGRDWEPIVLGLDGRRYSTFVIFKELLERGSMYAVVSYAAGGATASPPPRRAGMFALREPSSAPATGALGAVPEDAYLVTKRYGDGRPWGVTFQHDIDVEDFPFAAGTEAWFKRSGEIISGVLSRPTAFGLLQLPSGTVVRFYSGHRDRRVSDARIGADQADVVRGAIESYRLEAREPAGARLGGGGDAV